MMDFCAGPASLTPELWELSVRNLITDVEGLKVGHAEDARLGSGTTVFAILSTLALAANRYAFLKPIPPIIFFLVVPVALLVSLSRIPRVHARWIGMLCVAAAALVAGTATALSVDLRGTNESTGGTGDEYGYGP